MKGSDQRRKLVDEEMDLDYLFHLTMKKKWDEVVEFYRKHPWAHSAKLTKSEETALHVAVSSYNHHSERAISDSTRDSIFKMINSIAEKSDFRSILSMRNDNGDTPLHLAAAVGWVAICDYIALTDRNLITIRNVKNETPLFVAAHHGKLEAFLCLHEYTKDKTTMMATNDGEEDDSLCRRKDGNTILHSAISGEYFKLAYQIMSYYPKLVNAVNMEGETPLHVLAQKPNVFKSSMQLGMYDAFIYHCVFVDELKKQRYIPGSRRNSIICSRSGVKYPENYHTCLNIFWFLWNPIHKSITAGFESSTTHRAPISNPTDEENQRTSNKDYYQTKRVEDEDDNINSFPANYATCFSLFKFAMKVTLTVLGVGFYRIRKIKEKKQRHSHAFIIMNQMIESEKSYKYDSNGQKPVQKLEPQYSGRITLPASPPSADNLDPEWHVESNTATMISPDKAQNKDDKENDQTKSVKKDSPLLLAAKMGIPEMVEKILNTCPVAIQDLDSDGKNVLLLAAENRQTNVFDYLLEMKLPEYVFHQVDKQGNSILHLAAMLGDLQPWHIPGAALQMQWEIKWYKHVKHSIPPLSFAHNNINGETPRKIFSKTHEKLVKEGTDWLIKTSESCSVIAALIATVAFATSATVPGGLDEKSGHPNMEDHTAFDVFSITSLVALCLAVTALVFFLAIITSRCQESDFKTNLPKKLLMGLTSLFGSIAAMLVSFCAGHTFILREKLRLAAVPIYAIACIPVTFFAFAQLPLYFDLLWATFRKVPLRSYKVFYQ